MVQSITISSGPVIQMAVETGNLDIPAPMRHAVIQGSIVSFSGQWQSSAHGQTLCCDVAAAAVEQANEASAQTSACRALTEAAGRT